LTAISERRFGVEIEHGFPGGYGAASTFIRKTEWGKYVASTDSDGSGVEMRTVPLQGEEGFAALKGLMDSLREGGGYVTRADGMHVHFESKDYYEDRSALVRLVRQWNDNQPAIDQLVDANRRKNGCTPKWSKGDVTALEKSGDDTPVTTYGPRGCLNLAPLGRTQRTIEIRQHEGTLDPEVATAWIKFCQAFLDNVISKKDGFNATLANAAAETRRMRSYKTCRGLVDYLSLPDDVRERLLAKARAEKEARGKSRMLTLTEAQRLLERDGGLRIARANDTAMGPVPGVGNEPPIDAGDVE
jgi:hypothetical protein